jgi:hypothetical protein
MLNDTRGNKMAKLNTFSIAGGKERTKQTKRRENYKSVVCCFNKTIWLTQILQEFFR